MQQSMRTRLGARQHTRQREVVEGSQLFLSPTVPKPQRGATGVAARVYMTSRTPASTLDWRHDAEELPSTTSASAGLAPSQEQLTAWNSMDVDISKATIDPHRLLITRIMHSTLPFQQDFHIETLPPDATGAAISRPAPAACIRVPEAPAGISTDQHPEVCVHEHPGSVSCTAITVQRDEAAKSVQITLTTTVKLAEASGRPWSDLAVRDLEHLGYIAGIHKLADAACTMSRQLPGTAAERHDHVMHVLEHGRIIKAEKSMNQFGHPSFKLELEVPGTTHRLSAMFKPCVEGHCNGWHRVEVEAVAYQLNRLLGMDYVPPTVYRSKADVDWQHFELGGVFMYWAEGAHELKTQPMHEWGRDRDAVLSDARILDVLIQNSDRHHGHFLWGEHWATGKMVQAASMDEAGTWKGTPSVVFIDHAAGFRPEAHVDMGHDNAFNTGPTVRISARTFLRMRCLERSALASAVGNLLAPAEVDAVMRRRDGILTYFDTLIRERGYAAVVVEEC